MKAANSAATRGKTARACDSCLKKQVQWFCAADEAFLCQACDSSVHSANQLASRHLRVRIDNYDSSSTVSTASSSRTADEQCLPTPTWHQGLTRKARTPRNNNNKKFVKEEEGVSMNSPSLQLLVPQMEEEANDNNNNNNSINEEEHDSLCRVPIFGLYGGMNTDGNLITGFLDSDANHDGSVEFAADVESLLLAAEEGDDHHNPLGIKEEEEEEEEEELGIANCYYGPDFEESLMGWDFDYELPMIEEDDEEDEKKPVTGAPAISMVETSGNLTMMMSNENDKEETKSISLRLNHEAVMAAWATRGSPLTTGSRPALNPNDYLLHCKGTSVHCEQYGGVRDDHDGREARVSRYREKRRTRLFSKKIRYEVRKLNAEKRPRMKGRFVKRTTTTSSSFVGTRYLTNK